MSEHHIHYDSSRPDITFLIVFLKEYFRSNVVRSSYTLSQFFIILFLVGNAKVNNFNDLTVFLEKHIFRFQVTMYYSHMLQVKQYFEDLFDGASNVFLREFLGGDDLFKKLSTLAELQY